MMFLGSWRGLFLSVLSLALVSCGPIQVYPLAPAEGPQTGESATQAPGAAPSPLPPDAQPLGEQEGAEPSSPVTPSGPSQLKLGAEVLLESHESHPALVGKRLGLITNQTGVLRDGRSVIDVLFEHSELTLVALFSPEHGIRGTAQPGETVQDGVDEKTGLPIRSLYGETKKPTPEMLRDIDTLVFDIQDIGARYYTYVWTMALALEAASEQGKSFVVLDRPNPLGGARIEGNVLDPSHQSFVGLYPVPMRHGMTTGELARWIAGEYALAVDLTVIPLSGWFREDGHAQTGLPWIAPSPSIQSLESAQHYPGTCLFEGTNLSVGRGTPLAFQQVGAPWVPSIELAFRLNALALPGVRFEAVTFTPEAPSDGKYDGVEVHGIRFVVTDMALYEPVRAALAVLVQLQRIETQLQFTAHFDKLAGTQRLRARLEAGEDEQSIREGWAEEQTAFLLSRARYLLYPERSARAAAP